MPPRFAAFLFMALGILGCAEGTRHPEPSPGQRARGPTTLEITFTGRACAEGTVRAALYDSVQGFEAGEALRRHTLATRDRECRWSVGELPPGRYAVKAFLDLDEDGELGRNALGAPAEPYGLSEGARGRLGPPPFAAAAFPVDGPVTIEIEIR